MLTDPLLAPVRLLEVAHVAHRLSASPWFVRQLIRSKALPAIRLGARWRVDPRDLEAYIDRHRHHADPPEQHRGRDGPRLHHAVSQDKGA